MQLDQGVEILRNAGRSRGLYKDRELTLEKKGMAAVNVLWWGRGHFTIFSWRTMGSPIQLFCCFTFQDLSKVFLFLLAGLPSVGIVQLHVWHLPVRETIIISLTVSWASVALCVYERCGHSGMVWSYHLGAEDTRRGKINVSNADAETWQWWIMVRYLLGKIHDKRYIRSDSSYLGHILWLSLRSLYFIQHPWCRIYIFNMDKYVSKQVDSVTYK